jgi:myo-inositol-1(or 4)-monophosphatase
MRSELPMTPDFPYGDALSIAITLARRAGDLLLSFYRRGPRRVITKSTEVDLLTEADLASQDLILTELSRRFPDHSILAEETGGHHATTSGALWLVDPLDGTTNFAHRFPVFAVSIALWVDGRPQVGVVQDVVRERTYWAAAGQGAWLADERRLQVSETGELGQSLLATGFPYHRALNTDNNLAEFNALMPATRGVRRPGSAALDMAWVAEGCLDGYWEPYLAPWDWAAGMLLVTEAGGTVSDYGGGPLHGGSRTVVASNGRLHAALLAAVQEARRRAGLPLVL